MTAIDLVAWLRVQFDEEAKLAEHARRRGTGGHWHQVDPDRETGRIEDENGDVVVYDEGAPGGWEAEHIALHDPARVLAEVEAKRRILDLHEHRHDEWRASGWREAYTAFGCTSCHWNEEYTRVMGEGWCQTVRLLALPYSDRSGYNEEWRPA